MSMFDLEKHPHDLRTTLRNTGVFKDSQSQVPLGLP